MQKFDPPDTEVILYMLACISVGGISSLAALLGEGSKQLRWRVVSAYVLCGVVASFAIVAIAVEQMGFSWYLLGVSALSGFKAVDFLTIAGAKITKMALKFKDKDKDP